MGKYYINKDPRRENESQAGQQLAYEFLIVGKILVFLANQAQRQLDKLLRGQVLIQPGMKGCRGN